MGEITGLAQALRQPKFLVPISLLLEPVSQQVALGLCHSRSLVVGWGFRSLVVTVNSVCRYSYASNHTREAQQRSVYL